MNTARTVLRVLLPILVLGAGVGALRLLASMREPPGKREEIVIAEPVAVVQPSPLDGPVHVSALGTTTPAREVALQAEVTGRVTEIDARFVSGGVIAAGTTLVQLDNRDYWLQIKQAQAQVKQAQVAVQQEESRKAVAEKEWTLLGDKSGGASARGRALALREPQIEGAQAQLTAARSALDQARLAYQRTEIAAPFNAIVRSESVEVGQIARPGALLGTLIGTDAWWVQVSIPAAELRWLRIPGSPATVVQAVGGGVVRREGTVVRQLADVDPSGMMARVIVEVDDPLGLETDDDDRLLLGATVTVELDGRTIDGALAVPRVALREVGGGEAVWVAAADDTLAVVPVQVVRRERDRVLVTGLDPEMRVISSRIAAPVPGMRVRPPTAAAEPAAEPAAQPAAAEPAIDGTKTAAKGAPSAVENTP